MEFNIAPVGGFYKFIKSCFCFDNNQEYYKLKKTVL